MPFHFRWNPIGILPTWRLGLLRWLQIGSSGKAYRFQSGRIGERAVDAIASAGTLEATIAKRKEKLSARAFGLCASSDSILQAQAWQLTSFFFCWLWSWITFCFLLVNKRTSFFFCWLWSWITFCFLLVNIWIGHCVIGRCIAKGLTNQSIQWFVI